MNAVSISAGRDFIPWARECNFEKTKVAIFYSDRSGETRIWTREAVTGALRRVPTANVRTFFGFEGPRWTPDSRRLLVKLLPMDTTVELFQQRKRKRKDHPARRTGTGEPLCPVSDVICSLQGARGRKRLSCPRAPDPISAGTLASA